MVENLLAETNLYQPIKILKKKKKKKVKYISANFSWKVEKV